MAPASALDFQWDRLEQLVSRDRLQTQSASFSHLRISHRDQRVFALAARKLDGEAVDFNEALRALREAVDELIPAGRTFLLGDTEFGPIIGSIISGVGIVPGEDGVLVVQVGRNGHTTTLGRLSR